MIVNSNFNYVSPYKPNVKQQNVSTPSFGCKVINVSKSRISEIVKEFEDTFKINDRNPIPDFLKDIDIESALKPLNFMPPELNPKPIPHIKWKPQMSESDVRRWNSGSTYMREFYHGTSEDYAEKICKEGFDPTLSGKLQYGGGIYLTTDFSKAKSFGDKVLNLRINSYNPMVVDNSNRIAVGKLEDKFDDVITKFAKEKEYSKDEQEVLFNEEMRKFFTRKGFDMVYDKTYDNYKLLNPEDIVVTNVV